MAERSEVGAIYTAAVVQGLALVTFPAASTIFTGSSYWFRDTPFVRCTQLLQRVR